MRIVLTLFVCCSIGCSGIDLLDMDLNLAAPEGGVELTSLAMDGESVQVTRSNNTAADGAGH